MMTAEATWPDDMFSSAEIEELQFHSIKAVDELGEPLELTLYFTREKAHEFLHAVELGGTDPNAQYRLLSFCAYVGRGVAYKLDEVENGRD